MDEKTEELTDCQVVEQATEQATEQVEEQASVQRDVQADVQAGAQAGAQADVQVKEQAKDKKPAGSRLKKIVASVVVFITVIFGSVVATDVLKPDDPNTNGPQKEQIITEDDPSKQDTDLLKHRKLADLPAHVQESYIGYSKVSWKGLQPGASTGTKAGGVYNNRNEVLPATNSKGEKLNFKEYDVNNKIANQNRDAERFVVSFNPDGTICDVYYTSDHYDSFTRVVDDKYR